MRDGRPRRNVLSTKKLAPKIMAYYTDDDATPRPFRVVIPDEWDARTPYIPRRKSSQSRGPVNAASMANVTRLLRTQHDQNATQDHPVQKARFPIDGYDPVRIPHRTLYLECSF